MWLIVEGEYPSGNAALPVRRLTVPGRTPEERRRCGLRAVRSHPTSTVTSPVVARSHVTSRTASSRHQGHRGLLAAAAMAPASAATWWIQHALNPRS